MNFPRLCIRMHTKKILSDSHAGLVSMLATVSIKKIVRYTAMALFFISSRCYCITSVSKCCITSLQFPNVTCMVVAVFYPSHFSPNLERTRKQNWTRNTPVRTRSHGAFSRLTRLDLVLHYAFPTAGSTRFASKWNSNEQPRALAVTCLEVLEIVIHLFFITCHIM